MPFEPGQILLVEFPFTDHGSAKMRPVVVISLYTFNVGEDFVALPISTTTLRKLKKPQAASR